MTCDKCNGTMIQAVRSRVLAYRGHSETVEMPGLYCRDCAESTHTGTDMEVSDLAIKRLKAKMENQVLPKSASAI